MTDYKAIGNGMRVALRGECKHGNLARSCEICERDRELEWLRSWHTSLSEALNLPDGGRYRNDALERITDLRNDHDRAVLTAMERNTKIHELRGILRRILKASPHSMCSDAEAWAMAEREVSDE